jgi:hypothetical protein
LCHADVILRGALGGGELSLAVSMGDVMGLRTYLAPSAVAMVIVVSFGVAAVATVPASDEKHSEEDNCHNSHKGPPEGIDCL